MIIVTYKIVVVGAILLWGGNFMHKIHPQGKLREAVNVFECNLIYVLNVTQPQNLINRN